MATTMQKLEAALAALDTPRPRRVVMKPVTRAEYQAARAYVATTMVRTQADLDALLAARSLQIAAE